MGIESAHSEYRWYKSRKCGILNLGTCYDEVVEKDFDFTKREDRLRFNEIGFDCSVRKRGL